MKKLRGKFVNIIKRQLKKRITENNILNSKKFSAVQLSLLNKANGTTNSICKIKSLHDLKPKRRILTGYSYLSKSQENLEIKVPELNLYLLKNAIVNSRSSAIIENKIVYYEAINDNERFNEGFVKYHHGENALINFLETENIEEGFFLAGNGSYNWYHWLIEILPKMLYFDAKETKTILLDESCREIASMGSSLNAIIKNMDLKILYLNPMKSYKVERLYFINEVNKLMYNIVDPNALNKPLYYYRKESLLRFSTFFKEKVIAKDSPHYIFIERKDTHRIAKNESEIGHILEKRNFKKINLNLLNFDEQVNLFYNSKVIVGTTGAALTNIIFCQPGTKIVVFMPSNYIKFKYYSELASMMNVDLEYLIYENNLSEHINSDFVIDENILNSLLDKNNA